MKNTPSQKQKGYGLFSLAAVMYACGVVIFSGWLYYQQRNQLLDEVDASLAHATHATTQILGDVFLACAVETETSFQDGYTNNQRNMEQFARECDFDLLGAVALKDGRLWQLIMGGLHSEKRPGSPADYPRLVIDQMVPSIMEMARHDHDCIEMQTLSLDGEEAIRVALRYHPVSHETGYAILVARETADVNNLMRTLTIRSTGIGVFLLAMAVPLIALYNRTRAQADLEAAKLHDLLKEDFEKLKERESELEDAIRDLERFNTVALGRESRVIELKAEVNALLEQMGQRKRYNIDHVE